MPDEVPTTGTSVFLELDGELNEFIEDYKERFGTVTKKQLIELAIRLTYEDEEVKAKYHDYVHKNTEEIMFDFGDDDDWDEDEDLNAGLDPSDLPGSNPTEEDEEFARDQTEPESWDDMMDDIDSLGEEDNE